MPTDSRLRAEITQLADDAFVASFRIVTTTTSETGRWLGEAISREPTMQQCATARQARLWVIQQAATLGIPDIEWVLATIPGAA